MPFRVSKAPVTIAESSDNMTLKNNPVRTPMAAVSCMLEATAKIKRADSNRRHKSFQSTITVLGRLFTLLSVRFLNPSWLAEAFISCRTLPCWHVKHALQERTRGTADSWWCSFFSEKSLTGRRRAVEGLPVVRSTSPMNRRTVRSIRGVQMSMRFPRRTQRNGTCRCIAGSRRVSNSSGWF